MANEIAVHSGSVLTDMAVRYGMDKTVFMQTIKATCFPSNVQVSNEQFAAFLLVARDYKLNPITKEIFAFPAKGGGIQPIVSVDGWMNMINSQPTMDGIEFEEVINEGKVEAITCRIYRKDRSRPATVTEYMAECKRNTDTWRQWPIRMLRHKAAIQCARVAFGFAGIMEPDEYERMSDPLAKPVAQDINQIIEAEIQQAEPTVAAEDENQEVIEVQA
jgi:phage recombination protein Bet